MWPKIVPFVRRSDKGGFTVYIMCFKANLSHFFLAVAVCQPHYHKTSNTCTSDLVYFLCRYARLHQLSEERAQKLEDSKKLQQFLRDVDEVSRWRGV